MATIEEEIPPEQVEGEEEEAVELLPGELPSIKLTDDQERELVSYLTEEIDQALRDRKQVEEEWEEIQKLYEATTIEGKENFPFEGAATVMIPVIATACEEVWAWLMGIIFAPKDVFTPEPLRPEFDDAADPVKKFIRWALKEELALEEVCSELFMEFAKFGSMVAKTIYTEDTRTLRLYNASTREYDEVVETIRHSPEIIRVPLDDFIYPIEIRNLDESPWLDHREEISWAEVLRRRDRGDYDEDAVSKIKAFYSTTSETLDNARREELGMKPAHLRKHVIHEVWFEYTLEADAEDQDTTEETPVKLVCHFHKESGTLLRIQHNWYPLQLHPFDFCPFIPREGMLPGIGVGRIGTPFQIEVSTMHCQRLDNATISNCVAFKYKTDSLVGPNFRLSPGKGIPMDDPEKDLIPLVLGQKFDSTLQEEEHTLKFFRDRIGVGKEVELGETSTNAIMRAAEARTKSNAILKNVRRFLTSIMEKCLLLYQQHYPDGKPVTILGEDGQWIEQIFKFPPKAIYYGLGISVTATKSAVSKDQERQNEIALFNLLVQYYQQGMQYLVPILNPQTPPAARQTALEIIEGLSSYIRTLLDDFDIPGRDKLVISTDKFIELAAAAPPTQVGPGGPGASGPGDPNSVPPPEAQVSGQGP